MSYKMSEVFFILRLEGGVLTFVNEDNSDHYFSEKKKYNLAFPECLFFEKLYAKNFSQTLFLYCSCSRLQIFGYLSEAVAKQFPASYLTELFTGCKESQFYSLPFGQAVASM